MIRLFAAAMIVVALGALTACTRQIAGVARPSVPGPDYANAHLVWISSDEGNSVARVSFSPDGRTLVAGASAATIWDVATHRLMATLPCSGNVYGGGFVRATAFSPDSRMLAVAGACDPAPTTDGTLRLFDTSDYRLLGTLPDPGWDYLSLAFSPDGTALLAAGDLTTGTLDTGYSSNAGVSYFDPVSQRLSANVATPFDSLVDMALAPDGRTAALDVTSGDDSQSQAVQLFDVTTGQVTATLVRHESNAVAFSPDGRRVAATEYPGVVQVWDMASHAVVLTLVSRKNTAAVPFTTLTFSPDGRVITVGDYNGGLTFWDAARGRLLSTQSCDCESSVYSLTYNHDGSVLAMGTGDGRVVFFSP